MTNKIQDLQKAIETAKHGKNDIRGKEYSTVPLRIELFRRLLNGKDIESLSSIYTRVEVDGNKIISRAYLAEEVDVIFTEDGNEVVHMKNVKSTGTAEEDRQASSINKTSAVENGETSAIGRMLGILGVHGGQLASFEEVKTAQETEAVVQLYPETKPQLSSEVTNMLDTVKQFKTQKEVNDFLVKNVVFFDNLQSKNEKEHQELKMQVTIFRDTLPE